MDKYYKYIIALIPGHVYWKDKNGVFLGCNLEQARDAGFNTPEEMIGKTDYDMPWHIQAEYLRKVDNAVMKSGVVNTVEELFELPDGTKKTYLSKKIPLYDENEQIMGVLGISFDITERKKLEAELKVAYKMAEDASQVKSEFLKHMRHDIRTPLSGILGFSEIIKRESSNTKVREYTDNLKAATQALLDFLNNMLDIVNISCGEIPIQRCKFVLQEVVNSIIRLMLPKAIAKNIELILSYGDDIPKYIVGDPKRIVRILLELISNSLNCTESGFIKITVSLATKQNKQLVLSISVQDTGVGMPEHEVHSIRLRFGKSSGKGFGLSIVKQFIDDMSGEIYCESELKKGSTFTCLIPVKKALLQENFGVTQLDELMKYEKLGILVSGKRGLSDKFHILVIEDERIAALAAQSILEGIDCIVDIAMSAKSATELLQYNDYDLIFMDLNLPDLSGYDLTKSIRANEWSCDRHTPIVALTAYASTENKQKCIAYGMDAVLSKPLRKEIAIDMLNAFVLQNADEAKEVQPHEIANRFAELDKELIDVEALLEIFGVAMTDFKHILAQFIESLAKEIEALHAARQASDWVLVSEIAAKNSESAACYCAHRLKYVCIQLERYSEVGNQLDRDTLCDLVIKEMECLLAEWQKINR